MEKQRDNRKVSEGVNTALSVTSNELIDGHG